MIQRLREEAKQLSFHSMLYNKIPEDHLFKVIDRAVDYGLINPLVAGSYCKNFGRPAKEPEIFIIACRFSRLEKPS